MGEALARNLMAAGLVPVASLDEADLVVTFCTSQEDLEEVYLGEGGLVSKLAEGTMLMDCSATTPSFAREMAALASINDLLPVEAPLYVRDVTAAQAFADRGNLAVLAAGEENALRACKPVLEAIADDCVFCGPAGQAQLAKCALTLQQALRIMGQVESDALCRTVAGASGADGMREAVAAVGGQSPQSRALAVAIEEGEFASDYTVEVMFCELNAALAQAEESDLITPLGEAAQYLLRLLAMVGGVDLGPAALTLMYRDEEECASYGLDWSRAEAAYTQAGEEDDDPYGYDLDDDEWAARRGFSEN